MADQADSKAPYVFLSYASVEQERALAIGDALQQAGIAIWLDRHAIAGGSAWSTEIVRGIRVCAAFVVLGSERAFRSPNVQRELNLTVEENRPVLPLLLEQVSPPDDVRYALAGRQWVSLLERPADAWLPEVVRALAGLGIVPMPSAPMHSATVALPANIPTNLPSSLTSFLGREQELAALADLLAGNRLVTLTGPGGTGKTRLALQLASAQVERFPDGVFFIDLAPLADPALVPSAVAQALGVQGMPETPLRDSVLRFLREKRLLLLLDNFEHLLVAAEFAGALLQAGPGVTLLVTSRAPLRIPGEREYPVQPLPLPAATLSTAAALAANPTVALFIARARDVRPDFVLSDENAAAVAAICTRLDGLPLAIELAAARVRVLPPAQLLTRLTQRLPLLSGGSRTAPARQQTLRDTIAWSYALLTTAEQRLFQRLAVFAGGSTLELAEAVCNADNDLGIDVLDGVSSLLEKSLLRESDGFGGEPRYRMLETIREFALGELEASGEAETVRQQLAVQLIQLARRQAGSDLRRLDADLDNARQVLGWCVERAELGTGARLLWALQLALHYRGGYGELALWRQRLLALPEAAQPGISRARLLAVTSFDAQPVANRAHIGIEYAEAIALAREFGDSGCLAQALLFQAVLHVLQGQDEAGLPLAEEALALFLDLGLTRHAITTRGFIIRIALNRGDLESAEALLRANRSLAQTADEQNMLLRHEAWLAEANGDDAEARTLLEAQTRWEVSEHGEQSPDRLFGLAWLVRIVLRQGDTAAALAICTESLAVQRDLGPSAHLSASLRALAQIAEQCGLLAHSVRLLASPDVLSSTYSGLAFGTQAEPQAMVVRGRAALGEAAFAEAWATGEALSPDASIELGLAVVAELQAVLAAATAEQPG